jgi:DNA-binding Lrp family transcriptional regulator
MLDDSDRRLLSLLQADGRLTNADLAEKVGLSLSACHRRVKRLEEEGVIAGYSAVLDRKSVGCNVLAYVLIKLEAHSEELLKAFVKGVDAIEEIVACYAIAGGGDYLLKVAAKDMDAYAEVALKKIVRLPGVKDSSSNFVLTTLKREAGWPVR